MCAVTKVAQAFELVTATKIENDKIIDPPEILL